MISYPKTENLYARDEKTKKLLVGMYRRPDFMQVGNWLLTEKVDGTNIRLGYDFSGFSPQAWIRGRSDNAVLPKNFAAEALSHLLDASGNLDLDILGEALYALDNDVKFGQMLVVFGEGYGPGIQKGGQYANRKSLRIFDVVTLMPDRAPLWRTWTDVCTVARVLGLDTVPVIGDCSTEDAVRLVREGLYSRVAYEEREDATVSAEGLIARTDPYLFDYRGQRVMWKLKGSDLVLDPQCSGPGYAHAAHGSCRGYGTDRT